jgi:ElaB/YqjD/DUF883 family membrane-anchored ribosome-binding protein
MPPSKGADVAGDAQGAADDAGKRLSDQTRDALPELARRAERAFLDNAGRLRNRSREAASAAGEQLDTARMYVIERVQERPFTTTVAALGAGFLIGLLFAGRRR